MADVPSQSSRPASRRRKPRGGHNQAQQDRQVPSSTEGGRLETNGDAILALRPASIAPLSHSIPPEPSSVANSGSESGNPRKSRSHRGGGGGRGGQSRTQVHGQEGLANRGVHRGNESHTVPNAARHTSRLAMSNGSGRQFGGRLTIGAEDNRSSEPSSSSLQADAQEFRPGQQHHHRITPSMKGKAGLESQRDPNIKAPRVRRGSILKSNAQDIATRTHDDIANGVYECPICTSEISRSSKVWSCKTCWTVFHLTCVKKWSQNEGSTLAQQRNQDGELLTPRQWRCPGCNLPKDTLPSNYACWCEKEVDPRSISGIPPHSCGQTCGKHRILPKKCPHPCELLCHAGPCPPCNHLGPIQSCFCGKRSTSRRCVDTNYDSGWSCQETCGDVMSCGEHTCQRPCHEGLCGACEIEIEAQCYCGKVQKSVPCCERGDEHESQTTQFNENGDKTIRQWIGNFNCGGTCNRLFDCGKHSCKLICHSQDLDQPHCPRSPDVVDSCPCGKTLLTEITEKSRESCEDPIPNCQKECSKRLSCGHSCPMICHSGSCMPCFRTVDISCRCGRTTSSTMCHDGAVEPPQCARICRSTLNCGRHECGEHCCTGERKAAERQTSKRKLRPLGITPRIADEGFEAEHICTRLCGRTLKCGNHPCPELCHKGPCGTCREAIFDEISCHCGRTVLQPPLPCGTTPPPCRFECERPKDCSHPQVPHNCHGSQESCPKCPFLTEKPCMCGKKTLKNQQCWLADVRCGEICGKKLKCGSHLCRKQCHRPGECEDAGRSCQQACGKSKKSCGHPCEEMCHAPSSCREDKPCQNKMLITCDCQHLKQEVKCNASKTGEGNSKKSLKCDDECARLERNRKLALALNIDPKAHIDDHIPYSTSTLHMFQESVKWAQTQEREFRVFAADEAEKRLRFKPMPPHQRAFIHSLADDFGFDSESMDPEPHRHVFVFKTPKFVMAPMKTLADCVRIRVAAANEAASSTIAEAQRRLQVSNEPFNGFLLVNPRFGLTLEELRASCSSILESAPSLAFEFSFLPSEQVVLKARPALPATSTSALSIEAALKGLKASLASTISIEHLASSLHLCTLDSSLNILRRESDSGETGGWSQVAAKAAVGARSAPRQFAVGGKSSFTVLGSKLKDAKRKKEEAERERKEMDVVDDWEEEIRKEEEKEREKDKVMETDREAEVASADVEEPSPSSGEAGPPLLQLETNPTLDGEEPIAPLDSPFDEVEESAKPNLDKAAHTETSPSTDTSTHLDSTSKNPNTASTLPSPQPPIIPTLEKSE